MKPNKKKIANLIASTIPEKYLLGIVEHKFPVKEQRKIFKESLLNHSWKTFGITLEWIKDIGLTWEIETNIDNFCSAILYSPPDSNDILHEIVRDNTYGEMEVRLSCICGAIVSNNI